MAVLKPNHVVLKNAGVIGGKRTRYTIEGVPGLILDVTPKGSRSWVFRYQVGKGRIGRKLRYFHIGDAQKVEYSAAKLRAQELTNAVAVENRDPVGEEGTQAELEQDELTVSDLIKEFVAKHVQVKLKPHTALQYQYRLYGYVEPELGDRVASQVRKREIIELADGIAEEGKSNKKTTGRGGKGGDRDGGATRLADGVVEIISSMYGWAQKRDMLEVNPAHKIAKYHKRERRERVVTNEEFPRFWKGTENSEAREACNLILRLCLATGQRRSEVCGAQISEFDLKAAYPVWRIGKERTKNGLTHTVPLAPLALSLWQEAMKDADEVFVFPISRLGNGAHIHPGSVTKAMRNLRDVAALPELTVHDLRRTVRTRMAELRIPREISSRVLNHADEFDRGVHDESYNRYEYFEDKLEALMKWEEFLKRLIQQ